MSFPTAVSDRAYFTRSDLARVPDLDSLPGAAPFLRGLKPAGVARRGWEISQEATARDPRVFNMALREALRQGQNSVTVKPDLASRGLRKAQVTTWPELGGLPLYDVSDVHAILDGVPMHSIPIHLTPVVIAQPLAAGYLAYARMRGAAWKDLQGSIAADPLSHWLACGTLPTPLATCYEALAHWVSWASTNTPRLRTVGVDTTLAHDAGATPAQEIACALAMGTEHLRELSRAGVPAAHAASRFRFTLAVGPHFFTEISKFRALRTTWARVLQRCGVPGNAEPCAVHARTAQWNKYAGDAHTNLLRATTEACAAVLGGVDSLQIGPRLGDDEGASERITRSIQLLLAEEFHFANTADAAGGSWYIEHLTDAIAREAWTWFQALEASGGFAAALRMGLPQRTIASSAMIIRADFQSGRRVLVASDVCRTAPHGAATSAQACKPTTTFVAQSTPETPSSAGAPNKWPEFSDLVDAARRGVQLPEMYQTFVCTARAHDPIVPLAPLQISATCNP